MPHFWHHIFLFIGMQGIIDTDVQRVANVHILGYIWEYNNYRG